MGPGGLPRPARNLSEARVRRSLHEVMDSTQLCSLSTVTPSGAAHSAHVYFAYTAKLELYFLSDPHPSIVLTPDPILVCQCRYTIRPSETLRGLEIVELTFRGSAGRRWGRKRNGPSVSTVTDSNLTQPGGQAPGTTKRLEAGDSTDSLQLGLKSSTSPSLAPGSS